MKTQIVKEGIAAEIYTFDGDASKDLAVVRVTAGYKTPLQRVLKGTKTIEGYMSGAGRLTVTAQDGLKQTQVFNDGDILREVTVRVGDFMQWSATTDLIFYEICEPPYQDGRFEDLPDVV